MLASASVGVIADGDAPILMAFIIEVVRSSFGADIKGIILNCNLAYISLHHVQGGKS